MKYDTPTIVINNKWNKEWGNKPFNVFDIDSVKKIVETFNEKYLILYIRAFGDEKGYGDSVSAEEFNDYEVLSEYNNVITIQDIMKEYPDYSYNEIQLMMEATSDKHLTVAGANAIISSYFCGDVLIYRNPNCNAGSRGIWMTDSWLSKLSGANIIGRDNRNELIKKAKRLWL